MSNKSRFIGLLAMLLVVVGAGLVGPAHAGSLSFEIKADTSGMIAGPGGLIDISLNPAFPQSPATVSALVFGPATDGVLGAPTPVSGTATGDLTLPGGVTADNSTAANELTQDFSVGSFFDVFVTISGPEVGPGASGPWSGTVFNLGIFDAQNNFEQAQLIVNPNVDVNGNPIVDGTIDYTSNTTHPQVVVIPLTVPEPSGIVLMGLGLGVVIAVGRVRRRRIAA